MKYILFLALMFPAASFAQVALEAEVAIFTNYIWRGTTFTENKPAVQGVLDAEEHHGFFLGAFVSNAEFNDQALDEEAQVTQELDLAIGKRFTGENWETQFSYNLFTFPNAETFNSDEFNIIGKYRSIAYELSYMDDYFGYQGVYQYARLGYIHQVNETIEASIYAGYNAFKSPKGGVKSRCLDLTCTVTAQTTKGAGNPDYIDIFQVTRKTLENGMTVEFAINWTNRREYSVEDNIVSSSNAKDFALLAGLIIPVPL